MILGKMFRVKVQLTESCYVQERLSELKDDEEEPDAKSIICQRIKDGERSKKGIKGRLALFGNYV